MDWTPAGLWLAVIASGLYHGVNPGMGWPLAHDPKIRRCADKPTAKMVQPKAVH